MTLRASTIGNAGADCAQLSGSYLAVVGNTVSGCGAAGIRVNSGDVVSLTSGNSVVADNAVSNFSLVARTYVHCPSL